MHKDLVGCEFDTPRDAIHLNPMLKPGAQLSRPKSTNDIFLPPMTDHSQKRKRFKSEAQRSSWADDITRETFQQLNVNSDGSEPIIRNKPLPSGNEYERKRAEVRQTLGKVEHDMTRTVLSLVSKALRNQITLPFYASEFEEEKGTVRIEHPGAFRGLEDQPRRLTVESGPALITDQAGVVLLWYFPRFIGTGLQTNLMRCIADLAEVYQPPSDAQIKDRRITPQDSESPTSVTNLRYHTRSHASKALTPRAPKSDSNLQYVEFTEGESPCTMEDPVAIAEARALPEAYNDAEGEVRIYSRSDEIPHHSNKSFTVTANEYGLRLAAHLPFAYYFSPGWSQTGMHNLRSIQMSLHFRHALKHAPAETVQVLEAKRLLDKQLARLTEIIQPSLSRSLLELRERMSAVKGPTGTTVVNGWTSAFPCYGIAINRVTGLHRDSKGVRGGLDLIGVLGTFTRGGDLELPDLNLRLEWVPGCLGAFDGYDFRHKVHAWDALKLNPNITRATVPECQSQLRVAQDRRTAAIQRSQSKVDTQKSGAIVNRPFHQDTLEPQRQSGPLGPSTIGANDPNVDGGEVKAKKQRMDDHPPIWHDKPGHNIVHG